MVCVALFRGKRGLFSLTFRGLVSDVNRAGLVITLYSMFYYLFSLQGYVFRYGDYTGVRKGRKVVVGAIAGSRRLVRNVARELSVFFRRQTFLHFCYYGLLVVCGKEDRYGN